MITAWREKLKRKKLNNEGSTIVLVILALAFVGMLIAMLVYMVYYNYLMKSTDRAAKDNFYTAETALNEIQAGIARDVSDVLQESYSTVMKEHYEDTATNQQAIFETLYRDALNDKLEIMNVYVDAANPNEMKYSVDHLLSYLQEPYASNTTIEGTGTVNVGGVNVTYGDAYLNEGVLILADVRLSYKNSDGYVSIIETDIAIETPELTFNSIQDVPQIENYSLVAADKLTTGVGKNNTILAPAAVTIDGNVFGGDDGIYVNGDGYMKFVRNEDDSDTVVYTLTAASVNAMNGYRRGANPPASQSIDVSDAYSLWTEDIYVESAYMNLQSSCFVRDDLTTDGLYPRVTLGGGYSGYGNADVSAKNSSAILINGAHTTLDFAGLESLWLAGSAHVGGMHYNANELEDDYIEEDLEEYYERVDEEIAEGTRDEEEVQRNDENADIMMGQSLGVKSDQLMYMVPVECMGYEGDTQILAKNPMTIEEYNKLYNTFVPMTREDGSTVFVDGEIQYTDELVYTPVRLDVIMNKVGDTANSYGASYVPVFRRINGTILVYFYLDFENQDMANKFFRDYYEADQEAFDRYFRSYVRSFTWNSSLGSSTYPLSIAGNMLYRNGGTAVYMKEDTLEEDISIAEEQADRAESYLIQYTGLSKYLMNTSAGLSSQQLKSSVFDNIVIKDEDFGNLVSDGHFKVFKNEDDSLRAILVNNDGGYEAFEVTDEIAEKCALVIARGDVVVTAREYNGLIISGGEIRIAQGCTTISYDSTKVKKALILKNDEDRYVFEAIINGAAYVDVINGSDAGIIEAAKDSMNTDVVTASDLVKFQNWNKQ